MGMVGQSCISIQVLVTLTARRSGKAMEWLMLSEGGALDDSIPGNRRTVSFLKSLSEQKYVSHTCVVNKPYHLLAPVAQLAQQSMAR
eukprot:1030866-Pelagomonas_calceolata.AAC.3